MAGQKKRFHLNRSYYGLYVCPMIWRELDNFSSGSVCMVLASNRYDEAITTVTTRISRCRDYVRMMVPFLDLKSRLFRNEGGDR